MFYGQCPIIQSGTFQESLTQTISLSVNNVDSLTVISGSIPGGLRIENNNLVGTF